MIFNDQTLEEGMSFSYSRAISKEVVEAFAKVTGDINPIHLDRKYAAATPFKNPIAHGMLIASMFSKIFGTHYPGLGSIYTSQNLRFKKPVYIGDVVVATVTVESINYEKGRVQFNTICKVEDVVVIDGSAEIFLPKEVKDK